MSAAIYAAAVHKLADTGEEGDALFVRISDDVCMALARLIRSDPTFRAAVAHPNCSGMVDTYLLSVAS